LNKQELLEWIRDYKGKTIAILISCFYLIVGVFIGEWLKVALFLILPLACIFFSDAMSGYTGISGIGVRPRITRTTPGCFVAFAGWLLLLLPLLFGIFKVIFK
jgi:hypothetical protein